MDYKTKPNQLPNSYAFQDRLHVNKLLQPHLAQTNAYRLLGVSLAVLENSQVQLYYAEVETYNTENYYQMMSECLIKIRVYICSE